MELEDLAQRLGSLEQARAEDMQKAAQQAFMNKYGSRISNNDGLGLIILNELNRRGIDTSAADEAVQQILDQLRMEATMLLDTIKENANQASGLIDKIDAMDQSVQAAAAATGSDMSVPTDQAQSPELDFGDIPPDQSMEPPPDQGMPPPGQSMEPPPDQGTVSDIRQKKLVLSDATMKRIIRRRPTGYSPSSGVLAACRID